MSPSASAPADGTRTTAPAARTPLGPAPVAAVGVVLAVAVVLLGLVALREALLSWGVVSGNGWVRGSADALSALTPGAWAPVVAVVGVIVGLRLLVTALRPRRRTGIAVRAGTGVFLRAGDVRRLAAAAAEQVDGVLSATAKASSRRVVVTVRTTGGVDAQELVSQAVTRRLETLATPPSVRVRVRTEVTS